MNQSVVVLGSLNADVIVRVRDLPRPGQTILGGSLLQVPGGKGANQAVAAARLDATVRMVGCIGADGFGAMLRDSLASADVDSTFVSTSEEATGVALIIVNSQGENLIAVASGANSRLGIQEVEAAAAPLSQANVLLVQLETPLTAVSHALKLAHAAGVRTVLNAAPAQPLDRAPLGLADVVVVNEHELAALLGEAIQAGGEAPAAARLRQPGQVVVVTLGGRGAAAAANDGLHYAEAFRVDVVDTVGAGDAFVAGLAVAYVPGEASLEKSLRFASAAGALATTRAGAQPSLPHVSEVRTLLEAQRRVSA